MNTKLSSLITSLALLKLHDEAGDIRVLAALQRGKSGVDILAYARRIMNMFFPSLAKSVMEIYDLAIIANEELVQRTQIAENVKSSYIELLRSVGFSYDDAYQRSKDILDITKEPNRGLTITDEKKKNKASSLETKYFSLMNRLFVDNPLKGKNTTLKYFVQIRKKDNSVYSEANSIDDAALHEIKSVPLSSFVRKEELELLKFSSSIFNVHIKVTFLNVKRVTVSAVTMGMGALAYNIVLNIDNRNPDSIKESIQELYNEIVSVMVHEMTHVQQGLVREKATDFALHSNNQGNDIPYFDEVLFSDKGEAYNKNDTKKKMMVSRQKPDEDDSDIESFDWLDSHQIVTDEDRAMEQLSIMIKSAPTVGAKILNELQSKIDSKTLSIVDVMMAKQDHKEEYEEEKNKKYVLNVGETYHKEKSSIDTEQKMFNYLLQPDEVEAFSRGMMTYAKLNKTNFAKEFSVVTTEYKLSGDDKKLAWPIYKKMFATLNYDKKYLGTDAEALGDNY